MSKNIIEEIHNNKKIRNYKVISFLLLLSLIVIAIISYKLGGKSEAEENQRIDEETIMTSILGDLETVSYYLDRTDKWKDNTDNLIKYDGSYAQLLREVEQLKATLTLSDMILYNRGKKLPLNELVTSIEISFYIVEGLEMKGTTISNNFFEDNHLDVNEVEYLEMLKEDYSKICNGIRYEHRDGINMLDLDGFILLTEEFREKYKVDEVLLELKVDN